MSARANLEGGALRGVRVLDLTDPRGHYCGKLLADLGADVIKVEPPGGDPARHLGPFKDEHPHPEGSLVFTYYNTNKRSLAVDLERAEGREVLRRLVASADVLIESFEPARARELGLSYDELRPLNPRLVVTSIRGFGESGPHENYRATNLVVYAASGLMKTVGPPEGPPVAAPGQLAFDVAAVDAAIGTLCALRARARTGRGQRVEVAAQEVLGSEIAPRPPEQEVVARTGHLTAQLAPSATYECVDGRVELTTVLNSQWEALKAFLGNPPELARPEWAERPRRAVDYARVSAIVAEALRGWRQRELVAEAQRRRIPCGPVNSVADFVADPHVQARGFFVDAQHPYLGAFKLPGPPYRHSRGGWALRRTAPLLGEHTREVLGELGYSVDEIEALREAGVVAGPWPAEARTADGRPPTAADSGSLPLAPSPHRPIAPPRPAGGPIPTAGLPLAGIRVLAFSIAFAGPTTSRYLADFGAEVIKVESRKRPDNTRFGGPPGSRGYYREPSGVTTAPGFGFFNRNKLGVSVDLSQERGRELMRRLVAKCDVVLENFSLRVLKNWGMDFESLRAIKPDIVMLDMQGMGQSGPFRDYVTYGSTLHAYCGMTDLWGYCHSSFVDYVAAGHAALAILAALRERDLTGQAVHVDLAQLETAAALLGADYLEYLVNGRLPRPEPNRGRYGAPAGCYPCRGEDAWCVIEVTSDEEWRRLCEALGRPSLADEPRFTTCAARRARLAELDGLLEAWTRQRPAEEVERTLQAAGVPAAAVRGQTDPLNDPHLRARGAHASVDHPVLGVWRYPTPAPRLSETPGSIRRHAPLLGQDNDYVFGQLLGLSPQEIAELAAEGVLA